MDEESYVEPEVNPEIDPEIDPELDPEQIKPEEEIERDEDGNPILKEGDENYVPKIPQNPLKPELLKKSLKKLSKTYNGLSYAYIELDLKEKELDDIGEELNNYVHLRDINLMTNKFTHINPIGNMTYLVRLNGSQNEIRDMNIFKIAEKLQFLQILNLKENKIKELPEMNTVSLIDLNLETNLIETAKDFKGLPNLKKLNLKQNKLKTCEGIANMPKVEVIYLNENNLKSMRGLEELPNLRKLRLKTNKFEEFDHVPTLPNLEKLNIAENMIKDINSFSLLKFPQLHKINVEVNICFDEGVNAGAKAEILIQLEDFDIKAVNKEEVIPEDKLESKRLKQERIEERERQRIIDEQEKKDREEQERIQKEEDDRLKKEAEEEEQRIKKEAEDEAERERLEEERLKKISDEENMGEMGENNNPGEEDEKNDQGDEQDNEG